MYVYNVHVYTLIPVCNLMTVCKVGIICLTSYFSYLLIFRHCREPPGLSEPHVDVIPLTPHCKHLILMTDGVYKSIEATFEQKASIDPNKVLMSMVNHSMQGIRSFEVISDRTLDRIRKVHEDTFTMHAKKDIRSPMAVSCRKRDDMTLLIYQFDNQTTCV